MNGTNEGNGANRGRSDDDQFDALSYADISALYKKENGRLRGYLRNRVDDPNWIEDIIQDAFLVVAKAWATIESPRAYLYKVADRRAQAKIYRRSRSMSDDHDVDDRRDVYTETDRRLDLEAAIAQLPLCQRQAVLLHYLADLPDKEIADIMLIKVNTVRVHLHAARQKLKTLLAPPDRPHQGRRHELG
jgi:RNA polymerase sigma-70 factor (ECF subfamily)